MNRSQIVIHSLGRTVADAHGYAAEGADALRFYLMHKASLPAKTVLAMRPHELIEAYDELDDAVRRRLN